MAKYKEVHDKQKALMETDDCKSSMNKGLLLGYIKIEEATHFVQECGD